MISFQILAFHEHIQVYKLDTVNREIFAPFYFPPLTSLLAGEINTGQIPMSQIISYNTTLSGQIQDWVKPFASEKGENNTGAKITLYTVVELFLLSFP